MKDKQGQGLQDSLGDRTVLVIDDSEAVRTALDVLLSMHGARVVAADSAAAGLDALAREQVDLVIQDMNFRREATSGEEGIALFRHIRELHPDLPVILLTAWTHLETAVELVKAGAADYVAKPWDNARLLTTVRNLLDLHAARAENRAIRRRRALARSELASRFDLKGLIYESEAMHALASTAVRVAHADVPVLITGPNGAGKEVIADVVQANSTVKSGPYVKVNVGALPDTLMEVGAVRHRGGRLHRRQGAHRPLRGRRRRHDLPRRARQPVGAGPGEAPARAADGRVRAPRLEHDAQDPRARDRGDQREPAAAHQGRPLPRGPAVSPERHRARGADARRAAGRHPPARAALPRARLHARRRTRCARSRATTGRATCASCAMRSTARACCRWRAWSRRRRLRFRSRPSPPTARTSTARRSNGRCCVADGVVAHAARDLGLSRQALYRRMEKLGLKTPVDPGPQFRKRLVGRPVQALRCRPGPPEISS